MDQNKLPSDTASTASAADTPTPQPALKAEPMTRTADETPDGVHRYRATRIWHYDKPIITFVGLQASPGKGAVSDDLFTVMATGLAKKWGYGTLHICNLFTNIKKLDKAGEKSLVGVRNKEIIHSLGRRSRLVVFCWGDHSRLRPEHCEWLVDAFPHARCFGKTEKGNPISLFEVKDAEPELQQYRL